MARKTKLNDITNPELIAQVNPENIRLKNDFADYMRSIQRSASTISVYMNDLDIAFVWCLKNNNNKFFVDWTKRDIVSFQNWLINVNGNSPARVRRLKATLSSLSNFIESILDDEYPQFRNIVHKIENPINQPVREKTVLTDEQIDKLLNTLVEQGQIEKACMVALAICSGRRKAELVRFKVEYFNDENLICDGALYKTSEKVKTKGRNHGKYIYLYVLAKRFKPYLDLWIKYRKLNDIDSVWLFPDKNHPEKHMSSDTLNSWATTMSNILGTDFYWHAMRHAHVTYLVRAGIPDSVIQELIGWDSADMCRIYTDIEAEEQFAEYFKNGDIVTKEKTGLNSL